MVNMSAQSFTGAGRISVDSSSNPDGNVVRPVSGGQRINLKSRLPAFASDWARLRPTNIRFADGCALLNKLNPRRADAAQAIEVRAHPDHALPAAAELEALIDAELDNLEPERCMVSPLPDGTAPTVGDVHDALARGDPLVVGVHAPLPTGLGALGATRALVFGAGAIARTCTSARAPVATRQLAGQALVVFWPESRANAGALRGAAGLRHVIARLDRLAGVRAVVLRAGEAHVLPAGARYITLALGDERAPFAVQMKVSLEERAGQHAGEDVQAVAAIGKRSREGEDCTDCRFDGGSKRVKIEDM